MIEKSSYPKKTIGLKRALIFSKLANMERDEFKNTHLISDLGSSFVVYECDIRDHTIQQKIFFVLLIWILIAAATPKQIRELMKVDGLTNDEVKSHLQVGFQS